MARGLGRYLAEQILVQLATAPVELVEWDLGDVGQLDGVVPGLEDVTQELEGVHRHGEAGVDRALDGDLVELDGVDADVEGAVEVGAQLLEPGDGHHDGDRRQHPVP